MVKVTDISLLIKAAAIFTATVFLLGIVFWFAGIWTSGNDPLSTRFLTSTFVLMVLTILGVGATVFLVARKSR